MEFILTGFKTRKNTKLHKISEENFGLLMLCGGLQWGKSWIEDKTQMNLNVISYYLFFLNCSPIQPGLEGILCSHRIQRMLENRISSKSVHI